MPVGGSRALHAGIWSTVDIALRQGVQFATSIILARLLLPSDFGLVALAVFFSSFSSVFVQGGLAEALIQRQTTTREEESSVFWWNITASVVFAALLVLLSPTIGAFYHAPALPGLMALAALLTVCAALGGVQTALFTRALRFDLLAKAGLFSSLTSAAAAITAAWMGAGIWALGIQMATASLVYSATIWSMSDWRPVAHFRLRTIRGLVSFGAWLSLSTALEILYSQGFALLLGKLYGLRELGLYNRAASTQQLPANVFSTVIARIALPLLSMRSDDAEAMRAGMRKAIGLAMLINVPVMVGLALLPDTIIEVLFGPKWLSAASILSILAWSGVIYPLHVINLQALLSQGRTRTFFRVEISKKVVGVTLIVIGSFFGVYGLAFAQLAAAVVALFINVAPVQSSIGYGVGRQLRDIAGIVWATVVMAGVVLVLKHGVTLPVIPRLALLVAAGGVAYAVAGFLIPNRNFGEALDIVRPLLPRRGATEQA